MSSYDEKTSDQIEREVESSRASVQDTLRQLSDRMSPGQLVDQAFDYMKTSGGNEFASNLGRSVRDNPLPLLLVGAGIGWLMMGGQPATRRALHDDRRDVTRRDRTLGAPVGAFGDGVQTYDHRPAGLHETPSSYRPSSDTPYAGGPSVTDRISGAGSSAAGAVSGAARSASDAVAGAARSTGGAISGAAGSISGAASSATGAVSETASNVAGTVSSAVRSAADAVSSAYNQATDTASSTYEAALRRSHDARDTVSGAAYGLSDRASGLSHSVRENTEWAAGYAQERWARIIEEQPLVLGGIGLAIGAALGASLPRTQTENRLVGDASDKLKASVADVAQEQYEHAKSVAGETYDEVAEGLKESGIKEQLAGSISEAAEKIRETASSAAGQAKEKIASVSDEAKQKIAETGPSTGSNGGQTSSTTGQGTSTSGSSVGSGTGGSSTSSVPTGVRPSSTGSSIGSGTGSVGGSPTSPSSDPLTSGSGSASTSGLGSTSASGSAQPVKAPSLGDLDKKG